MKRLFIVCLLFVSLMGISQVYPQRDRVIFNYDGAGNQKKREICINCLSARTANEEFKEITQLKEDDLLQFSPEDVISYYPNPVQETLYLKWELINNSTVSKIDVHSLNGQLLSSYNSLEKENSKTITFQEYPSGSYSVILYCTNGVQKPITIIKQ
ncbi:T9SS type A sorting domain-containing protein [Flavobacterium sp. 316]|uniref:T9SS type A sorting domain-containing protein n=1 Tax=Flavobacterium sp. 316 TaxID=1603293 RepID=UPI0009E1E39F|nr:T9SS type A sorting domain-containing protein [Flavobacterium sp. 316]